MIEIPGKWTAVPDAVLLDSSLSAQARLLYVILLSYARPSEGRLIVWPRVDTLAKKLGTSESTVKRALKDLREAGLVERSARMGQSTVTRIRFPAFTPTRCHQRSPGGAASDPAEVDVIEVESPSGLSDSSDIPELVSTLDDYGSEGPPPESIRKQKEKRDGRREIRTGGEVMREWDRLAAEMDVAPVANYTIPSKRAAAQTLAALEDTAFRGKSVREIMRLLLPRIQESGVKVTFGLLFFERETRPRNLVALLSGDWARQWKQPEPERDPREELLNE